MAINVTDVAVASNGNIRWTGGATPNYTVLELHRFLHIRTFWVPVGKPHREIIPKAGFTGFFCDRKWGSSSGPEAPGPFAQRPPPAVGSLLRMIRN